MTLTPHHVHGTAIALGGHGILIRGRARAGKSALAFMALRRAEAAGLPARLVADDQVLIEAAGAQLRMTAPAPLAGLIELSGVGILREIAGGGSVGLDLLVDLSPQPDRERLPDPRDGQVAGRAVRRIVLPEREAALGAEILLHLARGGLSAFDGRADAP